MNTDNTQDGAEPSLASAGSRVEPFAWAAECAPGAWSFTHMRHVASRWPQSETIPLYSQPQPTLTDEERERVSVVADWASEHLGQDDPGVVALRALMERLK